MSVTAAVFDVEGSQTQVQHVSAGNVAGEMATHKVSPAPDTTAANRTAPAPPSAEDLQLGCYLRFRNTVRRGLAHPYLSVPLLGPLGAYVIDINLIELIVVAAYVILIVLLLPYTLGILVTLCIVMLIIPRVNILTYLTGISFERMVKYHRWMAYFLICPMLLHAFDEKVTTEWNKDSTNLIGMIALCVYGGLFLTTLEFIRRKWFEVFYFSHILAFAFIGVATAHEAINIAVCAPGLIQYVVDRIFRRMKSKQVHSASAYAAPGNALVLTVPNKIDGPFPKGFEAGQFAFLRIPSISTVQWHPISIASAPCDTDVRFVIRNHLGHGWAARLCDAAGGATTSSSTGKATDFEMKSAESGAVSGLGRSVAMDVNIDGPYGSLSLWVYDYDAIVVFGGGSGVTPMYSVLRDLHERARRGESIGKITKVIFCWTFREADCAFWFGDELGAMDGTVGKTTFDVRAFTTTKNEAEVASVSSKANLRLQRGRCDHKEIFNALIAEGHSRVAVLACGPLGMVDRVKLGTISATTSKTVFNFHQETFSF
eukprot:Opistho-2@1263